MPPLSVTVMFDDGVLVRVRAPAAGHSDAFHVFWVPNSGSGVPVQVGNELRPPDWAPMKERFQSGERPEKTLKGRIQAAEFALQAVIDFADETETGIPLGDVEGLSSRMRDILHRPVRSRTFETTQLEGRISSRNKMGMIAVFTIETADGRFVKALFRKSVLGETTYTRLRDLQLDERISLVVGPLEQREGRREDELVFPVLEIIDERRHDFK